MPIVKQTLHSYRLQYPHIITYIVYYVYLMGDAEHAKNVYDGIQMAIRTTISAISGLDKQQQRW